MIVMHITPHPKHELHADDIHDVSPVIIRKGTEKEWQNAEDMLIGYGVGSALINEDNGRVVCHVTHGLHPIQYENDYGFHGLVRK